MLKKLGETARLSKPQKRKKKKKSPIYTHMAAFKVFNLSVKGGRSFKIY
jgi:hypothetical protein